MVIYDCVSIYTKTLLTSNLSVYFPAAFLLVVDFLSFSLKKDHNTSTVTTLFVLECNLIIDQDT